MGNQCRYFCPSSFIIAGQSASLPLYEVEKQSSSLVCVGNFPGSVLSGHLHQQIPSSSLALCWTGLLADKTGMLAFEQRNLLQGIRTKCFFFPHDNLNYTGIVIGALLLSIGGRTHRWCFLFKTVAPLFLFRSLFIYWRHLRSITEQTHLSIHKKALYLRENSRKRLL